MVFSYLEKKASIELTANIETNTFDESNLIEIKTDLNMPYLSDKEYETAYGETVINGVHYQYVKRKIENNVMYLLCLPNEDKVALSATKKQIDLQNTLGKDSNTEQKIPLQKHVKQIQTEYIQIMFLYNGVDLANITTTSPSIKNSKLHSLFTALTPELPPEPSVA